MTTFDQIVPILNEIFSRYSAKVAQFGTMLVNRDLNGRIRLIVAETLREDPEAQGILRNIAGQMYEKLGPHAFPSEQAVLFETEDELKRNSLPSFTLTLESLANIRVVDRLVTESNWTAIALPATGAPRIVFFSIKGGVGRSTALAATAWNLAQRGKRVLVLDLDLKSPGISSALLPDGFGPKYGITDWLVEDLVDNGDAVIKDLVVPSLLSRHGEIYVAPAHGRDPGEYVAKLGRVWMPKINRDGRRERWSQRLRRLIDTLGQRYCLDAILINSRAGIDEIASACVTDLGAALVLLFATASKQTWAGYQILFRHWRRNAVAREIRKRLQLVGAMIPEDEARNRYLQELRDQAWDVFRDELYDEVPAGATTEGLWSFDIADEEAPHMPWAVRWNRGWATVHSLHGRLEEVDQSEVKYIFGPLLDGIDSIIDNHYE